MRLVDIALKARRILGDVKKTHWTDERLLDIINSGLADINKFAGAYRGEHFTELSQFRNRYPLPIDVLKVTSIEYNSAIISILNQSDNVKRLFATKDQLNLGVVELMNIPVIKPRNNRFVQGPAEADLPALVSSLDSTAFGLLTTVYLKDAPETIVAPLPGPGVFGSQVNVGSVGTLLNSKHRIAGRYGIVVSALKQGEYIHTKYRSLAQTAMSLEVAFPMGATWVEPIINWVVGTALQDDNDANNEARALVFLGRYNRELDLHTTLSALDYSSASKKYVTKYNGGIGR